MNKFNYWQKFEENNYYHIYNRGINGISIFQEEGNYYFLIRKWKELISSFFDTFGYCLMPNHFHFLVRVKPLSFEMKKTIGEMNTSKSRKLLEEKISYNDFLEGQFKRLFSSYALAFNKQQNRTGSLFQKRFKRVSIGSYCRVLELLAYIHHNPIHHKFTSTYEKWKFSSYSDFVSDNNTFIEKRKVLLLFDTNFETATTSFVEFHKDFKLNKEMS